MTWGLLSKYRRELMGAACLWVMLHHNSFVWPDALNILRRFSLYGNLGVDIFLLLSGIGLSYAWQKKPTLGEFYARRLVRILVPYVLFALPYWVWRDLYLGQGSFLLDATQLSLPMKGVITTWYIPAIACFYLLFPATEAFLSRGSRADRTVWLCGIWMVLCLYLYYDKNPIYGNCEIALTRLPVFLIGCALGGMVRENKLLPAGSVSLSILWIILYDSLRRHVSIGDVWIRFSYIPLSLAVCTVLIWIIARLPELLRRFLQFFGDRSLELYLTHVLIRNVFYHYIPVTQWDRWGVLTYAVILAVSLAVSTAMHPMISVICKKLLPTKRKEAL